MAYYDLLFNSTFQRELHNDAVTPFTLPEWEGKILTLADQKSGFTVPIKTFADYLHLPLNAEPDKVIDVPTSEIVTALAHRAAGAYQTFAHGAQLKYGRGAGIGIRVKFNLVLSNGPSLVDPACLCKGWVSYRMEVATCYQEWLRMLDVVKK